MMAQCSYCRNPFDSHDGGGRCVLCGYVACPQCEAEAFSDHDLCKYCAGSLVGMPMPGAFLNPNSKLWRRALRNARVVSDYRGGLSLEAVGEKNHLSQDIVRDILVQNREPRRRRGAPQGPRQGKIPGGRTGGGV